jgi:hypothetical protein
LVSTVLVLSTTGDGTVATRDLAVLHRNAAAETFHLTFTDGLLVETAASEATEPDMVVWFRDVEVFMKQRFRDAFKLSGARANQILEGYVAIGLLREKIKDDRTHYVYRRPAASKPGGSAEETDGQPTPATDNVPPMIRTDRSVRKTSGHGHKNEAVAPEIPNDIASNTAAPLIPPKCVSVVPNGHSSTPITDNGHGFVGYTRAREAEAVPACVTADEAPLLPTDSDALVAGHDIVEASPDLTERRWRESDARFRAGFGSVKVVAKPR